MIQTNERASSPALGKYLDLFEKNPKSRVFFALAETYRRMGMVDEAVSVLKQGLKHHPKYLAAYVSLAHCHYEKAQYENAFNILRSLVPKDRTNIHLQELYVKICRQLGKDDFAVEADKNLKWSAVKRIPEVQDHGANQELVEEEPVFFDTAPLAPIHQEESSWSEVVWTSPEREKSPETHKEEAWTVEKSIPDVPVATHMLADLYMSQGVYDKAKDVLEELLDANTDDQKTIIKLNMINAVGDQNKPSLMDIYDSRMNKAQVKKKELDKKFQTFLKGIRQKASESGTELQ
jgi:tetratricopeptide (TPR) repeat protein